MRVRIDNLGPIKSADIELSPLTVFVGQNNSGKSFAATTIHALLSRFARDDTLINFGRIQLRPSALPVEMAEVTYDFLYSKSKPPYSDLPEELKEFLRSSLSSALRQYSSALVSELERVAGVQAQDLRRMRSGRRPVGDFSVEFTRPSWRLSVRISTKQIAHTIVEPSIQALWNSISSRTWRRIGSRSGQIGGATSRRSQFLMRELTLELFKACFIEAPPSTRYLPAARSGLMQSHKVLSGSLIRQASLAGIRNMNIPAMSGVVTEFLGELVELDKDVEGPFSDAAARIENDLLSGHIEVSEDRPETTEVVYKTALGTLPLSRTSSMVSELAPVVLYLRNIADQGDLLFIEEPEAHLHPAAQIELAKAIIGLVNIGLRVGLTTHSEFFLQQLNNCMLASVVDEASRGLIADSDRLDSNLAAAYRFEPGEDGTVVTRLSLSGLDGITNSSFDEVSGHLYDEMATLEQEIANGS